MFLEETSFGKLSVSSPRIYANAGSVIRSESDATFVSGDFLVNQTGSNETAVTISALNTLTCDFAMSFADWDSQLLFNGTSEMILEAKDINIAPFAYTNANRPADMLVFTPVCANSSCTIVMGDAFWSGEYFKMTSSDLKNI
jgi:hypothetical protein